jgi:hypothetical protein
VDLMKSGCGVDYAEAIKDAVHREINGVRIPFASLEMKPDKWGCRKCDRCAR